MNIVKLLIESDEQNCRLYGHIFDAIINKKINGFYLRPSLALSGLNFWLNFCGDHSFKRVDIDYKNEKRAALFLEMFKDEAQFYITRVRIAEFRDFQIMNIHKIPPDIMRLIQMYLYRFQIKYNITHHNEDVRFIKIFICPVDFDILGSVKLN